MSSTPSKYYKLGIGEGLEALYVKNYNSSFPFHYHPTYNITLVYDGSFNTQLSDKLLVSPMGTILITNPQEIHANPFEKHSSVSFFTFYVSQDFMEYCNQGRPVVFNEKVIYDVLLFAALHQLATTIHQTKIGPRHEQELGKMLQQLASKHGDDHVETPDLQMKSMFDDFFAEENMKFSLADAAKRFGIDKFKFIRLFKSQTGLTPNNYFILKRIEKSKAMLAEGKDLLSIAIDLGFYDTAHYCNHFKKFTGISPIAYSTNL
ncbi:MAG: AraC family transcriptional regulator [Pedobacter sp.]|nr:AraC family transcriptional regulator [Pedobacter sp.]MDQ8054329.1 AraC family transcriptional regulator [Pedobacter sp.]